MRGATKDTQPGLGVTDGGSEAQRGVIRLGVAEQEQQAGGSGRTAQPRQFQQ
jgi:hypothetical protein